MEEVTEALKLTHLNHEHDRPAGNMTNNYVALLGAAHTFSKAILNDFILARV